MNDKQDDAGAVMTLAGPPLLIGLAMSLVYAMPTETLAFLVAWVLLSVPLGMLLGHCALGEDQ